MNIVCMSNFALTSFKCKEDHHMQLNRRLMQLRKESLKKFRHQDCPVFTINISNHKNFIPKYLEKAFIGLAQTSRTLGQVWRNKLP